MSYQRVIPRDLFNESSLLKCYGLVYLELEKLGKESLLVMDNPNEPFNIIQDIDGNLSINNIYITVRTTDLQFFRPLNSRDPFPLYILFNEEEIAVFNDNGSLTHKFIKLLEKD